MAVVESTLIKAGVQAGIVDESRINALRLTARRERIRLLEAVTREGRFPEAALYQALADMRDMPFLLTHDLKPDEAVMTKMPANMLQRRPMLAVRRGEQLYLVLADPDARISLETAQRATGETFELALAAPQALEAGVRRYLDSQRPVNAPIEVVGDADATGLLDEIMKDAYLRRASDIHFEPEKKELRVRLRVDGYLQEYLRPLSRAEGEAVSTRIKVLAGLDIAEQRMPQDGGMTYSMQHWNVAPTDIRVASIPTHWGERVTLRLLGQGSDGLDLQGLGMPETVLKRFREVINMPDGIILVTGPTGSGKSTTLYAALRELDSDAQNILTVEDPVEQVIEGISQVQVNIKVEFAQALRSFLRHDPDVILVGEIRDLETAETALKAAMTGHLVLSTLHTNDAIGAITRLVDIGTPPYLIGSTVKGVIAQRLVRRLCPTCRQERPASREERLLLGTATDGESMVHEGKGCAACLGTGYLGRIGIFEALWVNRRLEEKIAGGASEEEIRMAAGGKYLTLWQDALHKVREGETSLDEVAHLSAKAGN